MDPAEVREIGRLVTRAQRGDPRALELLVMRFAPMIQRLARHEHTEIEEDLRQELYVEFLRAIQRFVPGDRHVDFEKSLRVELAAVICRYRAGRQLDDAGGSGRSQHR